MQQPQVMQYNPAGGVPMVQQPPAYAAGMGQHPQAYSHQPQAYYPPPMQQQVVTSQPTVVTNVVNNNVQKVGGTRKRDWATDLFDCCSDMGTCCTVMLCPYCMLCMVSSMMDEGCCMPAIVPTALMVLRTKLRTQERIKGSILKDCLATTCCTLCTLCQIKREYRIVQQAKANVNAMNTV